MKSTEGATSSRLAEALEGFEIEVGAFAELAATEGADTSLGLVAALGAIGMDVFPLAPTVLQAPPDYKRRQSEHLSTLKHT